MLYIRLGLGLLMLLSAFEVFRAVRALNNPELNKTLKKIGAVIGTFGLLRIAGSFIDPYFSFAYFTTGSVYAFWLVTYLFCRYYRVLIQSEEVGAAGRLKISENASSTAAEMRRYRRKIDQVLN